MSAQAGFSLINAQKWAYNIRSDDPRSYTTVWHKTLPNNIPERKCQNANSIILKIHFNLNS